MKRVPLYPGLRLIEPDTGFIHVVWCFGADPRARNLYGSEITLGELSYLYVWNFYHLKQVGARTLAGDEVVAP